MNSLKYKKIFFFSQNKYKIDEIEKIFSNLNISLLSLNNLPETNIPEETGTSFEENASIKSNYGFKLSKLPSFADDSGICISALNNKPGIRSKEYLNKNSGSNKILEKIINKTIKLNNARAYFQSSIALTINSNKTIFFTGIIKGNISRDIKGLGGFGYDPIFIPSGYNKTFAEMNLEEKNKISHRAIAAEKIKKYLLKLSN